MLGMVAMFVRNDAPGNAVDVEIHRLLHVLERDATFNHQCFLAVVKQVTIALAA